MGRVGVGLIAHDDHIVNADRCSCIRINVHPVYQDAEVAALGRIGIQFGHLVLGSLVICGITVERSHGFPTIFFGRVRHLDFVVCGPRLVLRGALDRDLGEVDGLILLIISAHLVACGEVKVDPFHSLRLVLRVPVILLLHVGHRAPARTGIAIYQLFRCPLVVILFRSGSRYLATGRQVDGSSAGCRLRLFRYRVGILPDGNLAGDGKAAGVGEIQPRQVVGAGEGVLPWLLGVIVLAAPLQGENHPLAAAEGDHALDGQTHHVLRCAEVDLDAGVLHRGYLEDAGQNRRCLIRRGGALIAEKDDLGNGGRGAGLPLQPQGREAAQAGGVKDAYRHVQRPQLVPLAVGSLNLHCGVTDRAGLLEDLHGGDVVVLRDEVLEIAAALCHRAGGEDGGELAVHCFLKVAHGAARKSAQGGALLAGLVDLNLVQDQPLVFGRGLGHCELEIPGLPAAAVAGEGAVGRIHLGVVVHRPDGSPLSVGRAAVPDGNIHIVNIIVALVGVEFQVVNRDAGPQVKDKILTLGLIGLGLHIGRHIAVKYVGPGARVDCIDVRFDHGGGELWVRQGDLQIGQCLGHRFFSQVHDTTIAGGEGRRLRPADRPNKPVRGILEGQAPVQILGRDALDAHDLPQIQPNIAARCQGNIA